MNFQKLQTLSIGEAHVRSEGFSGAVNVQSQYLDLGPYPSDEEVARRMAPEFGALEDQITYAPVKEDAPPIYCYDELDEAPAPPQPPIEEKPPAPTQAIKQDLQPDHWALLLEIEKHLEASVAEHYQNLQWSGGRGNRAKHQLMEMGLVISQRQKSGNGRPREILQLTEAARQKLEERQHERTINSK